MNAPGKILVYFVAVLILGAALAPPLYWGVRALKGVAEARGYIHYEVREKPRKNNGPRKAGETPDMETKTRGPLRWLDADFGKVGNRATILAAVLLLWPLLRSLRIRGIADLGLTKNPRRWRDFGSAYATSAGVMLLLAASLLATNIYELRSPTPWSGLLPVLISGLSVGVLEEWIFRGAFLGTFRQTMRPLPALAAVSVIFAVVHFLNLRDDSSPAEVGWLSGFATLPHRFDNFAEPTLVLGGFVTLFCFGWVCGWLVLQTRSLAAAIGFHAGMVLGKFGFNRVATRVDGKADYLPWMGDDMTVGLLGTGVVILVGVILWRILPRRPQSEPTE